MSDVTFFDPIQNSIQLVEQRMRTQADGFHPELKSALTHLLSAGGKRIRVAVALLVGRMFQADPDRLITLAAAIELLHTATLVHDDLIDGALMRRGNPTLNARWTPAATVLTGDFLFAQAANLAADTKSVRVIKLFTETLATICDGEGTQMFDRQLMWDFSGYERRIYAKTASLFETGAFSAAILSDVPEQTTQDFKQYGYEIGMAFQIVDDILDYTGEQATVGKPVASDLRQGIMTLPVLFFLEQVKHARLGPLRGRRLDPEVPRDLVGRLESDAEDVEGQAVGVLLHDRDGALFVLLVDPDGVGRRHAMRLKEEHHVLDSTLLRPRLPDAGAPDRSDSLDVGEALRLILDHVEGVETEALHEAPGHDLSDPADEPPRISTQSQPSLAAFSTADLILFLSSDTISFRA